MPKRTHHIAVDDNQLIEVLSAIEVQLDILNDTVTEDLWVSNNQGSVTFTKDEMKELKESVEQKIDRLVNTQLLYTQLKEMVAKISG